MPAALQRGLNPCPCQAPRLAARSRASRTTRSSRRTCATCSRRRSRAAPSCSTSRRSPPRPPARRGVAGRDGSARAAGRRGRRRDWAEIGPRWRRDGRRGGGADAAGADTATEGGRRKGRRRQGGGGGFGDRGEEREPAYGSAAWLRDAPPSGAMRLEKKRIRREQEEASRGGGIGMRGGGGRRRRRRRRRRREARGGAHGSGLVLHRPDGDGAQHSLADSHCERDGHPWRALRVGAAGAGAGTTTMHQIPIRVPRQLYVNMRAPHDAPGWVKVSRTLLARGGALHV